METKKIIVVLGATGLQGTGVVNELVKQNQFEVRAITRNPATYSGKAHQVVSADLKDVQSLKKAFEGAYGVFAVTNFWEGADELTQGANAVQAAKEVGVSHFVWSTLPNVKIISNNEFDVPHFTIKAEVDKIVTTANFEYYTFVQPPFYYQNFVKTLAPSPQQDGTIGWTLPIDASKKVIHMGDINDLGKVVTGAFLNPVKTGKGAYLSLATELKSFDEVISVYEKTKGETYSFTQVPTEAFSTFFLRGAGITQLLAYFAKHTYMAENAEPRIALAKELAVGELTTFQDWIKQN